MNEREKTGLPLIGFSPKVGGMILLRIPLLVIVLIAFNIIIFTNPALLAADAAPVFSMNMPSGDLWTLSTKDLLIIGGVLLLYLEIFKATRTSVGSIIEHVLSLFVFLAFLIEFLVVGGAGNSTCVVLMLICLLDVIGGFTISISTARRDLNFGGGAGL
ncbi:MAG: hypothetical protein HKN23_06320 [Verrucomicrobiales bacterium]|nr:hypothetical protein [Verrucomicrobiales bacterium]